MFKVSSRDNANGTGKLDTALVRPRYNSAFLASPDFPPPLGVVGLVCGIVNLMKGRDGHEIKQMTISVTCAPFAMIGAPMMS